MSDVDVKNNAEANRYEVEIDGTLAELGYQRTGDRLDLRHTEVPDALEGRGLGSTLVKAAIEDAAREGLTVIPSCPFVRSWLERHPDEAATVTVEAPAA